MLIFTKLQRPSVAQDFLRRPRLEALLEDGRFRKLSLISAPAGYGKSSLVAAWLEATNHISVWFSLDRSDADMKQFLGYLVAGLQQTFPGSCRRSSEVLQSVDLPTLAYISANLINDLVEIDAPITIVLDDFHLIEDAAPFNLVGSLIQYLPRQIHIIMITRQDPALAMTQMRAKQEMLEIRMADLRFTEEETYQFLGQAMGNPVTSDFAHFFARKTEGWPVGLRLTALSARGRSDPMQFAAQFGTAEDGLVVDYLVSEVLTRTTPAMKDFMLKTSICDRFCTELCAVLVGDADPLVDAGSHINALVRTNLFAISIDGDQRWWRYHHLFQELLQHQLRDHCSTEEINDLHLQASAWFADQGLLEEAFEHAMAAGDIAYAARLVERNRHAMMNADQWHIVENWLARLPDEIKRDRPGLLLAQAWIYYFHHAIASIPPLLEMLKTETYALIDDEFLAAEIDFFHGNALFWHGQSRQSMEVLERALDQLPDSAHQARGEAELYYGITSQMSGLQEMGVRQLYLWLYDSKSPTNTRKSRLIASLIFIHILSGELSEAMVLNRQIRDIAKESNNGYVVAWTDYLFAFVHFARNELHAASECFQRAVEKRYILHTRAAVDSMIGQTLTYHGLGKPAMAKESLERLLAFAAESNDRSCMTLAHSCQARLALLQGDSISAARWLKMMDLATDVGIFFYWLEVPRLTECRVLIAQDSDVAVREGLERLERFHHANLGVHNVRQTIVIELLQALAHRQLGNHTDALVVLGRAVDRAAPGSWIRPFVELGPEMAALLTELATQHMQRDFISQLLAAFPVYQLGSVKSDVAQLPEPLTDRELEILVLLGQRLSNKEIAQELDITSATVKRHASNVYQKLQVNDRRHAVAKAEAIGLLM